MMLALAKSACRGRGSGHQPARPRWPQNLSAEGKHCLTRESRLPLLINTSKLQRQGALLAIHIRYASCHGNFICYPGDGDETHAQTLHPGLRRYAGNEPTHERHGQHAVCKNILHARSPGEIGVDMDWIVVAGPTAIESQLQASNRRELQLRQVVAFSGALE